MSSLNSGFSENPLSHAFKWLKDTFNKLQYQLPIFKNVRRTFIIFRSSDCEYKIRAAWQKLMTRNFLVLRLKRLIVPSAFCWSECFLAGFIGRFQSNLSQPKVIDGEEVEILAMCIIE